MVTGVRRTAHLVIDQQLHGVGAPLDEHDLVGLAGHAVGEGGPDAGAGAGLQPHADGEGVHLGQALLDAPVQIVSAQRQGQLELLRGFELAASCRRAGTGQRVTAAVTQGPMLISLLTVLCEL